MITFEQVWKKKTNINIKCCGFPQGVDNVNKKSRLCTEAQMLINSGFFELWISKYTQKNEKFSTVYPQIVENLRKLKSLWITRRREGREYVDKSNVKFHPA